MKVSEITEILEKIHGVSLKEDTVDGIKYGDENAVVTGIMVSCCASIEILQKAVEEGCNLIIVHEPVFYTHRDQYSWEDPQSAYQQKLNILREHHLTVYRDHDQIHMQKPDGISYGIMKELGWENYLVSPANNELGFTHILYQIPKTTVRELAVFLKQKMHLKTIRVIGNLDAGIEKVMFCGHILPVAADTYEEHEFTDVIQNNEADVLIPGELIDWTTASGVRDAGQLGLHKAIMEVGHFNSEELGMKYFARLLKQEVPVDLPVVFVPAADMYQYI